MTVMCVSVEKSELTRNCTTWTEIVRRPRLKLQKGKKICQVVWCSSPHLLGRGPSKLLGNIKSKIGFGYVATSNYWNTQFLHSSHRHKKIWNAISQEQKFSNIFMGVNLFEFLNFLWIFQQFCLDFSVKVFGFLCNFVGWFFLDLSLSNASLHWAPKGREGQSQAGPKGPKPARRAAS